MPAGLAFPGAVRATRDRVLARVDELDSLVRELRCTVWQARSEDRGSGEDVRDRAAEVPPARAP